MYFAFQFIPKIDKIALYGNHQVYKSLFREISKDDELHMMSLSYSTSYIFNCRSQIGESASCREDSVEIHALNCI